MVNNYEVDYLVQILSKQVDRWIISIEGNLDNFMEFDLKLSCYDGYNFRHEYLNLIYLDSYGDDSIEKIENLDFMKNDPYPSEFTRLNVRDSVLVVDKYLNAYLIDIKLDNSYELILLENKTNLELDKVLLHNIFGGKRAYSVSLEKEEISLRFNEDYENYLAENGLLKEIDREKMLSTHRITIPVKVHRNYFYNF